ncbi:hypothetical protein FOXYS1_15560, partial [Fusarium oxysporum]
MLELAAVAATNAAAPRSLDDTDHDADDNDDNHTEDTALTPLRPSFCQHRHRYASVSLVS